MTQKKTVEYPKFYKDEPLKKHLSQGDIIISFKSKFIPKYLIEEVGLIILSNTCDLIHKGKLFYLTYCPIFEIDVLTNIFLERQQREKDESKDKFIKRINKSLLSSLSNIAAYKKPTLFFLPPHPELKKEGAISKPCYADLEQISSIHNEFKEELLKKRKISLTNPWIEKLGYMLAQRYNRVATQDIEASMLNPYFTKNSLIQKKIEEIFKRR